MDTAQWISKLVMLTLVIGLSACGYEGRSDRNMRPTIQTAPAVSALANQTVVLVGTGQDANGDALSYRWEQINGELLMLGPVDQADLQVTTSHVTEDRFYTFRVTITDSKGATDTAEVVLTVQPVALVAVTVRGAIHPVVITPTSGEAVELLGLDQLELGQYGFQAPLDVMVEADSRLTCASLEFGSFSINQLMAQNIGQPELLLGSTGNKFELTIDCNNLPEIISAARVATAFNQSVILQASALDPDGALMSQGWSVAQQYNVAISRQTSTEIEFLAPVTEQAISIPFVYSVLDSHGVLVEKTTYVDVEPGYRAGLSGDGLLAAVDVLLYSDAFSAPEKITVVPGAQSWSKQLLAKNASYHWEVLSPPVDSGCVVDQPITNVVPISRANTSTLHCYGVSDFVTVKITTANYTGPLAFSVSDIPFAQVFAGSNLNVVDTFVFNDAFSVQLGDLPEGYGCTPMPAEGLVQEIVFSGIHIECRPLPVVEIVGQTIADYAQSVLLVAVAGSDGQQVLTYEWMIDGEMDLDLVGVDTELLRFDVPDLTTDQVVNVQVTVTDQYGGSASAESELLLRAGRQVAVAGFDVAHPIVVSLTSAGQRWEQVVTSNEPLYFRQPFAVGNTYQLDVVDPGFNDICRLGHEEHVVGLANESNTHFVSCRELTRQHWQVPLVHHVVFSQN